MKNLYLLLILITSFCSFHAFGQKSDVKALVKEGVALHDNGDYHAAIRKYEEALRIDKDNVSALIELSLSHTHLKNYENAIEYCDRVIALDNKNSLAYMNKGTALDLLGRYSESIGALKLGIQKVPDEYLLHFNLGVTYLKGQEVSKAEQAFLNALKINPNHSYKPSICFSFF